MKDSRPDRDMKKQTNKQANKQKTKKTTQNHIERKMKLRTNDQRYGAYKV